MGPAKDFFFPYYYLTWIGVNPAKKKIPYTTISPAWIGVGPAEKKSLTTTSSVWVGVGPAEEKSLTSTSSVWVGVGPAKIFFPDYDLICLDWRGSS